MPVTMRPTGGHSPVYADRQDWTILDNGKPVGRIYEDASSASTPADLRWFWSVTVYVDPKAGGAPSPPAGRCRRLTKPRSNFSRSGGGGLPRARLNGRSDSATQQSCSWVFAVWRRRAPLIVSTGHRAAKVSMVASV